jgi:acetylornithine deacetylase/succinyl-diaminopimelate desuccinylase-like protein
MNRLRPTALRALAVSALIAGAPPTALHAQSNAAAQAARDWRQRHERAIVDEFAALLAIPNIAQDRPNIRRNAEAIAAMLSARGIEARLVEADGANPVVFGEIETPGATRTIVFYAHYDGQPLDPNEWSAPPFTPTLRDKPVEAGGKPIALPAAGKPFDPEWRLYARGAGDDKAPIVALVTAVDALKAARVALKSNVRFAFEGEEEAGSPNLERIIAANKALFAGDVWLMCDGPVHQTRRQLLYFGSRDGVRLDLTVYGPKSELHSGHYGNWAPNPALDLARLLASMKDEHGRVLVEGFYDGVAPLGELERRALAEAPDIDAQLMRELWLGATDGAPKKLVELITEPSLNIRGMASSRVGAEASNVIPASATASIDIRLVKGMDPQATLDRVVAHVRKQGFFVVAGEPDAAVRTAHAKVVKVDRTRVGLGAVRTPMNLPIAQEVVRVVESVRGPTVKLPTMGGNLPLADIARPLGAPTIIVPIANHDDNQHSFDENLRLQNLWDGIELMAALLAM